jgi:hypothetical protein
VQHAVVLLVAASSYWQLAAGSAARCALCVVMQCRCNKSYWVFWSAWAVRARAPRAAWGEAARRCIQSVLRLQGISSQPKLPLHIYPPMLALPSPFVPRACRSSLLSSCLAPRVLVFVSPSSCVCLPAAPFVFVLSHSLRCLRPCKSPLRCSLSCPSAPLVVAQRTGCITFGLGYPLRGGLLPCTSLVFR